MSRRIAHAVGATGALALVLAAVPSAHAAGAVYGGSTTAPEPIVVNANRSATKLTSAVIAVEAKCDDGDTVPLSLRVTARKPTPGFAAGARDLVVTRNNKRRFSGVAEGSFDFGDSVGLATTKLSGRLKDKRASGSLKLDVSIVDKQTQSQTGSCHSGALRWTATRSPGRVYGGASSQEEPVVVRLDNKRKTVRDMLAGWESSGCTPPSFMRFGEDFTNFPLRGGSFADSFEQSYPDGDGALKFAYTVGGKVKRGSASGTLHVGVTGTDAGGATTMTCDSGNVTWKAVTG